MTALEAIETSAHTDPMASEVYVGALVARGTPTADLEKAGHPPVKPALPPFPDGGNMAWMVVAGSWLVLVRGDAPSSHCSVPLACPTRLASSSRTTNSPGTAKRPPPPNCSSYSSSALSLVHSTVVGYELARDASISTTARATLMLLTLLENNRRLSHHLYCS
ncbi:hypothetical protein EHS25_004930 [Saitozyma podzolica]|uniref:Uncharacterized protein n=1 Tax=Saitozyma podzolica TaxID=1890683 RepID=A0A427Y339_9TREE|nr:hypothetical protein EHS25_004930 [Saitozyma podzolica]